MTPPSRPVVRHPLPMQPMLPPTRWKRIGGRALTISLTVHLMLLAIGLLWVLRVVPPEPERQFDFVPRGGGGGSPEPDLAQRQLVTLQPVQPARIAAVGVTSALHLPEPEEIPSIAGISRVGTSGLSTGLGGPGSGGGFGSGRGTGYGGGMSAGAGPTPFAATFFNLPASGKRIAYVIDFSHSMKGRRQALMRDELVKSISTLQPTQHYQLIFFAGPAWVAGWDVRMDEGNRSATVISDTGTERQWTAIDAGNWKSSGRPQKATWLQADDLQRQRSTALIRRTGLLFGTFWQPALELALQMDPAPDVVYFMTDGVVTHRVYETIDDLARLARRHKTIVNTVSMMEPAAADAMRTLATKTGGTFTLVQHDGTSVALTDL